MGQDVLPSKPKVTDFDVAVIVDEDILRLNIPMHHSSCMEQVKGAEKLVEDLQHVWLVKFHFL